MGQPDRIPDREGQVWGRLAHVVQTQLNNNTIKGKLLNSAVYPFNAHLFTFEYDYLYIQGTVVLLVTTLTRGHPL